MQNNKKLRIYNSREEMEYARAREAAQRSYTERFRLLMKLIRVSKKIRNAKIISSPAISDNLI